jgi:hypothetical protein
MASPSNILDSTLANPAATTVVDGATGKQRPINSVNALTINKSSYSNPTTPPAIVIPPAILDAATPTTRIPPAYQPVVRKTVSDLITSVLTSSRTTPSGANVPRGSTDVGSGQYTGVVSTRLFSGIRSLISSSSPSFGIPTNKASPIANDLAAMANIALSAGKNEILGKYGSTITNALQYIDFTSAVVNRFQSRFDSSPLSTAKEQATQKAISNTPIQLAQRNAQTQMGPTLPAAANISQSNQESGDFTNDGASNFQYKVYLISALDSDSIFVFNAQPSIQVSEEAAYSSYSPLHAPGEILSFKNNPARTFSIGEFKLISRTPYEAQENLKYLHMLRSWTKPYFGQPQVVPKTKQEIKEKPANTTAPVVLPKQKIAASHAETSALADTEAMIKSIRVAPFAYVDTAPIKLINDGLSTVITNPIDQALTSVTPAPNLAISAGRNVMLEAQKLGIPLSAVTQAAKAQGIPLKQVVLSKLGTGGGVPPVSTLNESSTKPTSKSKTVNKTTTSQTAPTTITSSSAQTIPTGTLKSSLGSPPEVLYLYGYSEDGNAKSNVVQNLRRIPVVITSISFTYPNDVDYIPTVDGIPFPIVMNIAISLRETKSPYEIEHFSLADFRMGKLIGW